MATLSTNKFIPMMESWFAKVPALPKKTQEALAQIAPWIALIFGILYILGYISILGWSAILLFGLIQHALNVMLGGILEIIASILLLMAYPGLMKKSYKGWTYLFWSEVVRFVSGLVAGSIVGPVIGALIGFYLIFQIKSYYK